MKLAIYFPYQTYTMLYSPNLDIEYINVSQAPRTGLLTTSTPPLVSGWWFLKIFRIPPHLETH